MQDKFFSFSFEHWPALLLSFVPALTNLAIFFYVLLYVKRSSLSTSFLVLVFLLFMWQMEETMLRICATEECARIWNRMFSLSTGFVTSAALHFIFFLLEKKKLAKSFIFQFFLYMPNFFFTMLFISDVAYSDFVHTENWGWIYEPQNILAKIGLLWMLFQALLMVGLLIYHSLKLRHSEAVLYKQVRIIIIGSSIPAVFGSIFQGMLPIFFDTEPIPMASALVLCFSVSSLIAITRYNLFEYSPAHQWDSIVENMNEGILIVDNHDIIQYVNHEFCRMLGYSNTELLNRCAHDTFALSDDKKVIHTMMERGKKLFRDKYEIQMKRKDGTIITCEISAQPYLDQNNKVIGSIGIHTDITRQKAALKKIKDSESRYRSLVEQATDGIFIAGHKGQYIDVNHKACQMLGYSKREFLEMSISDVLFKEDIAANPVRIDLLLQGKSILSVRNFRRKDGSSFSGEINAAMMPDKNLLGIVRDITERKRTEEELLEKVEEMDAFIYRASHDLRGPLASITGLTTVGKSETRNSKAVFYLEKINDSVARLDDILQELSKIARVTQAKIETEEINLKKEVDDILNSLKHLPDYSRIEFKTEIAVPDIQSDKILLIIVLQNLLINSIYYFDKKKDAPYVKIAAREKGSGVEIILSDNGVGIPADIRDKVFEMFYRGTTISKGSGLGLYIVKNALKKLKGSIRLESKEGEGTVFSMTLPGKRME